MITRKRARTNAARVVCAVTPQTLPEARVHKRPRVDGCTGSAPVSPHARSAPCSSIWRNAPAVSLSAISSFLRVRAPLLFHPRSDASARLRTLCNLPPVEALKEFARFVFLLAHAAVAHAHTFAPTRLMEIAWRACVLETRLHAELQALCGVTLHYSARDFCDDAFHAALRAQREAAMADAYAVLFDNERPINPTRACNSPMHVIVFAPRGVMFYADIDRDAPMQTLKYTVRAVTDVPVEQQRLTHNGVCLTNWCTPRTYGVRDGDFLMLEPPAQDARGMPHG